MILAEKKSAKIVNKRDGSFFESADIQTLDLMKFMKFMLQSDPNSAGSSLVIEDEGFMQWTFEGVKLLISLYHKDEHKFADVNFKIRSVWEAIAKGQTAFLSKTVRKV